MYTLPFSKLTNHELLNTLEDVEKNLREKMNNPFFKNFLRSQSLLTDILDIPFKYYNTEDVAKTFENTTGDLIMHENIRSLDKHFGKLLALMSTIDNPIVTCLSEIGQKNLENRKAQLSHLGYDMYYTAPDKVRGGVAIICKMGTETKPRPDLEIPKPKNVRDLDLENLWYEVDLPNIGKTIIGVVYKHPNSTVEGLKYFRKKIETNLRRINKEGLKCAILGDINIDSIKVMTDDNTKQFFETCLINNFIPVATLPSRFQNNSCTAIDHIIINQHFIKDTQFRAAGHIFSDISDHLPNFLFSNKTKAIPVKKDRRKIRIFGDKNINKFRNLLSEHNWDQLYETTDPNEALDKFYDIYNKAFNQSFPIKTLSRKCAKDKDWITKDLKKRINEKNKLFQEKTINPTPHSIELYKTVRNQVAIELDKAEKQYYSDKFNSGKNSLKALWDIAGSIINPNKLRKHTVIKSIKYKGKITTDKNEIAESMNKFFSTIGENLAKKIKSQTNFKRYLKNPIANSMTLKEADEEEIIKIILSLKSKKSAGADGIRPLLLKKCGQQVYKPIMHIMNLSLRTNIVPDKLKIAKVIPVHKKEDKSDPGNYRPISLLSMLHKILEKLMCIRLTGFLNENNILYKYQFGFRAKHSTTQAVTEIVDNLLDEIDSGKITAGIYLDLSKAFDTVDHNILLTKLQHYGIRGEALGWFQSYLTNRQQFTVANGNCSTKQNVLYGVPQGSVLGPLLFLIYVNDIAAAVPSHKLRLFADDSNIFVSDINPRSLKCQMISVLTKMDEWFRANKLTINMSKTKYSIFVKQNHEIPNLLNSVIVNGTKISRVSDSKYLGLVLDDKLNWSKHIDELNEKLSKTIQAYKIVTNFINTSAKYMLYYAYFYSRIQYGCEIYTTAPNKKLKSIQVKQNRALKVLFRKDFYTPTTQLHKELKIPLVKDIGKLNALKLVHKVMTNQAPEAFDNYFTKNKDIPGRRSGTRQDDDLSTSQFKTNITKKTFKCRGATYWNSISKEAQNTKETHTFGKYLKQIFIANY